MATHLDNIAQGGSNRSMSSKPESGPKQTVDRKGRGKPVWAEGLRRMYDEVVDEQLPSDFLDLLKKLDQAGDGK